MDADERDRLGEKLWCAIGLRWPWRSVEEWHREQYRIAAEAVLAAAPPWRPVFSERRAITEEAVAWCRLQTQILQDRGDVDEINTCPGNIVAALAALGYLRRPPAPDSGNAEGSA